MRAGPNNRGHGTELGSDQHSHAGQQNEGRCAVVMETDLHSAFDQIKRDNRCVCSATTQNPTKSTQDEILLRAELATVPL